MEENYMKIAEALILRADCQKRIEQLKQRLLRSAKVQEGVNPPEDPKQLLVELDRTIAEFTDLIKKINKTNSLTGFQHGKTLTDVLAERDTISLKRIILSDLIEAASVKQDRYSKSEVRFLSTVNIAEIQKQVDDLSKNYRVLDSKIQEKNWKVELIEN